MSYRVVVIPPDIAEQTRATLASPQYGHPAHTEVATGYGPCRVCLQKFREGEEGCILFTYDPFGQDQDVPLPSPIYIHRDGCVAYRRDAFPNGLRDLALAVEAHSLDRRHVHREIVEDGRLEQAIESLFADSTVEFIHIRNAQAGCFICRIERAAHAKC